MAHQRISIVCGSLLLILGLTPCSSNAQTTAIPPPPERQNVSDQPAMAPADKSTETVADKSTETAAECSSRVDAAGNIIYDDPTCPTRTRRADSSAEVTKDPAAYKRQVSEATAHARKAELAGNEGNIPEMLRQTKLSLEQAQAAQKAGTNPILDEGITDLKETLLVGQRDQIAPSALREGRIKLAKAATIQTVSTAGMSSKSGKVLTGELRRSSAISTFPEQEAYAVRDPQSGADTPVFLSPDMSRQVKEGDTVQAQIDSQGRVVAISKSPTSPQSP